MQSKNTVEKTAASAQASRQYSRLPEAIKAQVQKSEVKSVTFMRKLFTIHVDKIDGTRATFVEYANGTWKQEQV